MAGRLVILLSVFVLSTNRVAAQGFFDLFQGLQPYLKNVQTDRGQDYNIFTQSYPHRRPQVDSLIRDDSYSNEDRRPQLVSAVNNDRSKETSRTTKASRRKSTTPAQIFNLNLYTTPKTVKKIKNNSSQRNDSSKVKSQGLQSSNSRRQYYDEANNVDYNRPNLITTRPTYATRATTWPSYNWPTTPRPNYLTTKFYYDSNVPAYNSYTTQNPLYNRPPITNRPATSRPSNSGPVTSRPNTSSPVVTRPATPRPYAVYPKPTDSSAIRYPEEPDTSPEMIVGVDEDSMSSAERRRYIDLSEKMCDKYKALNVKKVEAIPLVPSPEPVRVNVSVCPPSNIPLVVGGKVTTIEEFPHMALLGWTRLQDGGYSWKCGGSLISDQFVLTAGHCAYQGKDDSVVTGAPRVVQLGSSYLDDTGALVMKVLSVVTHPKYIQTRSYYDIALVKMVKPVTFSQVVKPACLGVPPAVGSPIIATGWGRTEFGGTQSLELRSVSIPIWDMGDCAHVLGTSRKLPDGPSRDSQICAGEKNGGKDTCQGDSGGPAQIQDGCAWRVVAVTSVGRSCGAPNTPALYATLHRAFIAAQVFGRSTTNSREGYDESQTNSRPFVNNNNGNYDRSDRRDVNSNSNTNYNSNNNINYANNRRDLNDNSGNADYNSNNRRDVNSNTGNTDYHTNGNNRDSSSQTIVYPQDGSYESIYAVNSYTTHRPMYNNGWYW